MCIRDSSSSERADRGHQTRPPHCSSAVCERLITRRKKQPEFSGCFFCLLWCHGYPVEFLRCDQKNKRGCYEYHPFPNANRNAPLSLAEGGSDTGIPFVTAWRFTSGRIQMPNTDNPYLYLVLDGMLRLYTPSGMMDYVAGQYSLSKIDTPLSGTVLAFSHEQDLSLIHI